MRSRNKSRISLLILSFFLTSPAFATEISEQIIVDQFGWRADAARKVVVFANPQQGQNSGITYIPGATFEVRRLSDDISVFTGDIVSWNDGQMHTQSGDQAWWGDFSDLTAAGEYYIYDPQNDRRSFAFALDNDIYNDILVASVRTYYYQRCGTNIPASHGGDWIHKTCHVVDTTALLYNLLGPQPGSNRNVSGGWHDAGDYNKYVPFLNNVLFELMMAYEINPHVFGDQTDIPESGNDVPDLLDEIKWELDWLLRMQDSTGGVYNRVAVTSYANGTDDPASDPLVRRYTAITTWATACFAGHLAHAARLFEPFAVTYPGYSDSVLNSAKIAWMFLESTPDMRPASGRDGPQMAAADAGSNAGDDKARRVLAAAELYRTTGEYQYKQYFEVNFYDTLGTTGDVTHPLTDDYIDPYNAQALNQAYVTYYLSLNTDPTILAIIKEKFQHTLDWYLEGNYDAENDPYRAYMWDGHYTWSSNSGKSHWANILIYSILLNINPEKHALYGEIAEEYLHYLHGRNPLSIVYLTNMGEYGAQLGAEKSAMEPYHGWFRDGSAKYDGTTSLYGPAPGFLTGGPNQFYSGSLAPPKNEPPMKAFRDWNSVPELSWEITEPAIYYQSAYSLLLSNFCSGPGLPTSVPAGSDRFITPESHYLFQNSPNPFNPITTIRYQLASDGIMSVEIYDVTGQHIQTLENSFKTKGNYQVRWNGLDKHKQPAASGFYIYRLKTGNESISRKMLLLR